MPIWQVFIIAVGLGMDAFSVALAVGTTGAGFRRTLRMSLSFGFFQFFMPMVGWGTGHHLFAAVRAWDHWVAFGILAVVGVHMLVSSFRKESDPPKGDATSGWRLLLLSVATSIDALGVGFGLGILKSDLLVSCVIIGIVAALMTVAGMRLGNRVSRHFGRRAEAAGGVLLIALAVRLLSI